MDKPRIEVPTSPAPTTLVTEDIVVGDGAEATPGADVEVHYAGFDYETGREFDSSWTRMQTIEFNLNRLILGWQEGLPGMKVGGRRMLICPPEYAYGPAGGGHPLSGRALIFVIDLISVS